MALASLLPGICGLCRGSLVDLGPAARCASCGEQPNAPTLTRDGAFDYLANAALNLSLHPAPGLLEPRYAERMQAHRLALAFLMEALRKLGEAA